MKEKRANFKSLREWCQENDRSDILSLWDNKANLPLTVDTVSKGQNIYAKWHCMNCGHKWTARISAITHSVYGCPKCSRKLSIQKRILKNGSLYDVAPWLEKEFLEKENGISIKEILPQSNKKYLWRCNVCNHIWPASAATRVKGHGCPACNHLVATKNYNLETEFPEIAKQWHPTKNAPVVPSDVLPYSETPRWWQCEKGHEWMATPSNRVQGRNCRQCSNEMRTSFPEQCIVFYLSQYTDIESRIKIDGWEADIFLPTYKIAIEYDGIAYHDKQRFREREQRKNKAFKDNDIDLIRVKESYDSSNTIGNTLYFIVNQKYTNLQDAICRLIDLLNNKTDLEIPKDIVNIERDRLQIYNKYITYTKKNSLAENYPELVQFWNYEKNGSLTPEMFSRMSNKHVWWICPKCKGEWPESVINMAKGNRCPYCSGHRAKAGYNDLKTKFPEIASEWDYEANGNLLPSMFTPGSNMSVHWKCKNGHRWEKQISYRTHTQKKCPECYGSRKKSKDNSKDWSKKYELAKKYYQSHGDLLIPATYIDESGIKIGSWIRTQRVYRKNRLLDKDQIEALDKIGMVWEIRNNRSKI